MYKQYHTYHTLDRNYKGYLGLQNKTKTEYYESCPKLSKNTVLPCEYR